MKAPYVFLCLIFSLMTFADGLVIGKHEVFPYKFLQNVYSFSNNVFRTEEELKHIEIDRLRATKKVEEERIRAERTAEKLKIAKDKKAEYRKLFSAYSKDADVVFVGDSITFGAKWDDFFPNINTANRGVGGDTTRDVMQRIDSIISTTPKKVFIMLGINDVHQSIAMSETISNYEEIIDTLQREGIDVIVQSTISCYRPSCGAERVDDVNQLNSALKTIANKKSLNYLDLGELSSTDGLDGMYTTDGIHLTFEGYNYWVQVLKPFVVE